MQCLNCLCTISQVIKKCRSLPFEIPFQIYLLFFVVCKFASIVNGGGDHRTFEKLKCAVLLLT